MIGKPGALHPLPQPSSSVVSEALKLLATFGDAKSLGPVLAEIRKAQEHNEAVLAEAKSILSAVNQGRQKLEEDTAAHNARVREESQKLAEASNNIASADAKLGRKIAEFADRAKNIEEEMAQRESEIRKTADEAKAREDLCNRREAALNDKTTALNKYADDLDARASGLKNREAKLRAALNE